MILDGNLLSPRLGSAGVRFIKEEIPTIAGAGAMLLKIRTRDPQALKDLLRRIHAIKGLKGTRTYITLSSCLGRRPQPMAADGRG